MIETEVKRNVRGERGRGGTSSGQRPPRVANLRLSPPFSAARPTWSSYARVDGSYSISRRSLGLGSAPSSKSTSSSSDISSHASGGGASRRRSVLLSKASHPARSARGRETRGSSRLRLSSGTCSLDRRRSVIVGCTSHTCQTRPRRSLKVRCGTPTSSGGSRVA